MVQHDYHLHPVSLGHAKALAELHKGCFSKGWSYLEFQSFFERAGVFAAIARRVCGPMLPSMVRAS